MKLYCFGDRLVPKNQQFIYIDSRGNLTQTERSLYEAGLTREPLELRPIGAENPQSAVRHEAEGAVRHATNTVDSLQDDVRNAPITRENLSKYLSGIGLYSRPGHFEGVGKPNGVHAEFTTTAELSGGTPKMRVTVDEFNDGSFRYNVFVPDTPQRADGSVLWGRLTETSGADVPFRSIPELLGAIQPQLASLGPIEMRHESREAVASNKEGSSRTADRRLRRILSTAAERATYSNEFILDSTPLDAPEITPDYLARVTGVDLSDLVTGPDGQKSITDLPAEVSVEVVYRTQVALGLPRRLCTGRFGERTWNVLAARATENSGV